MWSGTGGEIKNHRQSIDPHANVENPINGVTTVSERETGASQQACACVQKHSVPKSLWKDDGIKGRRFVEDEK